MGNLNKIKEKLETNNDLIFLLNPPFNDQTGHSKGKDEDPNVVGSEFIQMQHSTEVSLRSIRSAYSKFLYRINNVFEEYDLQGTVAIFSKSSWLTGTDSKDFLEFWHRRFKFKSGFIVHSKLFRGTKGNWPVLYSIWERRKDTDFDAVPHDVVVDIFDEKLEKVGQKRFVPPTGDKVRLQDTLDKQCLKSKEKVKTIPMKNDFQSYTGRPYCDFLHTGGFGYLYCFANDVQHSGSKLMLLSKPYGGSNANGLSIVPENFESCLHVYGIRKSVKPDWTNDKDEFYITESVLKNRSYKNLYRMSILWSILEGGYTSSIKNITYNKKKYSFKNDFFALSLKELSELSVKMEDLPSEDSYASKWISRNISSFSKLEKDALEAYRRFILSTIKSGRRSRGDSKRQVKNLDASPRQLINGLVNHVNNLDNNIQSSYEDYLNKISELKQKVYDFVIRLDILPGSSIFSEESKEYSLTKEEKRTAPKLITENEMNEIAAERLEIAAHIINNLKDDPNLGRTKLAKIFYVSDALIETDLRTHYKREAAGPLDPNLIYGDRHGFEKMAMNNNILIIKRNKNSVKYIPHIEFEAFVNSFRGKWKRNRKKIDKIIEVFRPLNARQSEIIATLFACWNDLITVKEDKVNDEEILNEFFNNWHDKKKRFQRSKVEAALNWMREKKLIPKGNKAVTLETALTGNEIPF